jgi:hypothetical protein
MKVNVSRARIGTVAGYAGTAIRYSFYVTGIVVFMVIGLAIVAIWNWLSAFPGVVSDGASFAIGDSQVARRSAVFKSVSRSAGKLESLQYGQLHDRDTDMTVILVLPVTAYQNPARNYRHEIAELGPIAGRRHSSSDGFYDLQTRFGRVSAAEFWIDADGRAKLCASFLSRFNEPTLYYKGWYCEANGARPNLTTLACILDKLRLTQPLESAEATAFMQEAMKRPARCSSEPVSQTTDVRSGRRAPLPRLIR